MWTRFAGSEQNRNECPVSSARCVTFSMYTSAYTTVQTHGKITYNGHSFKEFIPQRTAAYINQTDTHLPELTVRETFDFAARSQGTGHKAGDWQAPNNHMDSIWLVFSMRSE